MVALILPMDVVSKIRKVRSRGLVVETILRWLSRVGVKIVPYHLYLESNDYMDRANLMERFKKTCDSKVMCADDVNSFAAQENLTELKEQFSRLRIQGSSCLYVISQSRVIAYAWFNLGRCQYDHLLFDLQSDEAYAFNFWTSKRSRWVAMFLAGAVYAHLRSLGRSRIYSVTEIFNTPAMHLRKKLHSTLCRRFLYVKLFNIIEKNIEIK